MLKAKQIKPWLNKYEIPPQVTPYMLGILAFQKPELNTHLNITVMYEEHWGDEVLVSLLLSLIFCVGPTVASHSHQ